jgi:hypothetical protein
LNIAPNGLSHFIDAKADERDLKTSAREAQRQRRLIDLLKISPTGPRFN